jgi:hypothetical protein
MVAGEETKMSKTILSWCGIVTLALSAALSAQTGTVPKIPTGTTVPPSGHAVPQPKTVPPAAPSVVATVTATGCVERWRADATAAPAGAAADKGPAGVAYMLTGVQGETQSASAAGTGKTEVTPPQTRYLLLPDSKVDFAAHLNHRVKITGSIAPQPSAGASLADAIADPTTRETNLPADSKSEAYRDNLVEVTALTMVARACGD